MRAGLYFVLGLLLGVLAIFGLFEIIEWIMECP